MARLGGRVRSRGPPPAPDLSACGQFVPKRIGKGTFRCWRYPRGNDGSERALTLGTIRKGQDRVRVAPALRRLAPQCVASTTPGA